jgi:hypothetical protein
MRRWTAWISRPSTGLTMLECWCRRAAWVPRDLKVAAATLATWPLRRSGGEVPPQTRWAKLPEMVRHSDDLLALYQLASSKESNCTGPAACSSLTAKPGMIMGLMKSGRSAAPGAC